MAAVRQGRGGEAPGPTAIRRHLPTCVVPSYTFTVLFAAAVPVSVSVLSLVIPSPTVPLSFEKVAIVGTLVPAVFTVTASADEAALVLPAASVAVAVKLWAPFAKAAVV